MADITPQYVVNRCTTLQSNWSIRTTKFKSWYNILMLTDTLEQEGMESVATNDPRTGYNLAKHFLTTMVLADKIESVELPAEFIPAVGYLEKYISARWADQEKRYRSAGRQSWLGEVAAWLLASGWYSIFAMVTDEEVWAEVWSPAESFPGFGPDGLVEHAHIYTLSPAAARRKLVTNKWVYDRPINSNITIYDLWAFDDNGNVTNAVVFDRVFVKEPVVDVPCTKVGRLPVFTSPAGGLPDMGAINTSTWQEHFGESIVATNEDLIHNYNKMRSFMQQAARTAAQPHWLELSSGDTPIASDELMDRWGSVLHGSPGEDVRPLQGVPIPVELTNILFHYQNELQRGMFPWAVFGNVQQQMSYLAMANVASAAMQILTPYKNAIQGMRTDVDNFWVDMVLMNGFKPHNLKTLKNLPPIRSDRLFEVNADIEIPGYLVQRATVARMLNPKFRLPEAWVMERLFPELRNTLKARADVRAEDAMSNPLAIQVDQILAYREQARVLREGNNIDAAALYEKLAGLLESQLSSPQEQASAEVTPTQQAAEQAVAREAFPIREATTPIEGLGQTT